MKQVVIHIGYHKTGTSWLQKEVFPTVSNAWQPYNYQEISDRFVHASSYSFDASEILREARERAPSGADSKILLLSNERLSGSPHSGGFDQRYIARRLKDTFPDAKIVIGIREQLSCIESCYKEYVRGGGIASLEQYIHPPRPEHFPYFNPDFFKYYRLVSQYINMFGKDNVLVLPIEILKSSPKSYLSKLGNFSDLNVEADQIKLDPVRVSLSPLGTEVKRIVNRFTMRNSLNPFPLFRIRGGHPLLMKILPLLSRKIKSNINYHRRVHSYFGSYEWENKSLVSLTGVDLFELGYS
jgi:hypothetical protein